MAGMARTYRPRGMALPELAAWILRQVVRRPDGCWDWPGARGTHGHGHVRHAGKVRRVHNLICRHSHGDPPAGKVNAIHSCGRPPCCNPAHLRWGSQKDNAADRTVHGRDGGPKRRGRANGRGKLNDAQVRMIRQMRAGRIGRVPLSAGALASIFGVSVDNVRGIVNGTRRAAAGC